VAQLYPGALDSLYVVSYDSQGYGGLKPRSLFYLFFLISVLAPATMRLFHQCNKYYAEDCIFRNVEFDVSGVIAFFSCCAGTHI
jgi:hypothetical protein